MKIFSLKPDKSIQPLSGQQEDADCVCSPVLLEKACVDMDGKRILSDISLDTSVARLGVVGRNGSGKSTLSRLLAGLIPPTSGDARIAGHDLYKDRRQALKDVGILFQNPDHQIIFPTVLEEIEFGLRQLGYAKNSARDEALEILRIFGKSHWKEVSTSVLSQGQKHLLCLMAVVAMRPGLIILDEPFAGLDIPTKLQLQRYLALYEGALIHITHDPDDIETYDEIIWLEAGMIKMSGAPDLVLDAYKSEMNRIGETDDISDLSG